MIVVRMMAGISEAERTRIWNEAVYALGPDRGLVGSKHWVDTNVIELKVPEDLLPTEHYDLIGILKGIDNVVSVYQDNGARALPGATATRPAPGRVRAFWDRFFGSSSYDFDLEDI